MFKKNVLFVVPNITSCWLLPAQLQEQFRQNLPKVGSISGCKNDFSVFHENGKLFWKKNSFVGLGRSQYFPGSTKWIKKQLFFEQIGAIIGWSFWSTQKNKKWFALHQLLNSPFEALLFFSFMLIPGFGSRKWLKNSCFWNNLLQ